MTDPARARGTRPRAVAVRALAAAAGCVLAAAPAAVGQDLGLRSLPDDLADTAAVCPPGTAPSGLALVVLARGSGEVLARDTLATRYYPRLARDLVARGYRVSGHDVGYPALPASVLLGAVADFAAARGAARTRVAADLAVLIAACPSRRVVVAGYSQGALAVREALTGPLAGRRDLRAAIARVDLFGDPSAAPAADRRLPRGRAPGVPMVRRTTTGLLAAVRTAAVRPATPTARVLREVLAVPSLRPVRAGVAAARRYPADLAPRVQRWCAVGDPVCDAGGVLATYLARARQVGCPPARLGAGRCTAEAPWAGRVLARALDRHALYPWAAVARDAARTLPPPVAPAG